MTIDGRKTGWLVPVLYYKFREILTHTALRYGLCCPMYCCMPDHLHLLWMGLLESCDQRNAARFFRRQMNLPLAKLGLQLQKQPYDHVLREDEGSGVGNAVGEGGILTNSATSAFEAVAEYIARNPERAGLVPVDGYRQYAYTGCLVPGYPDLSPWQDDYWTRFWKLYSRLSEHGLSVVAVEDP
jgi:hypothetical protein